jgi:hypothetical protein
LWLSGKYEYGMKCMTLKRSGAAISVSLASCGRSFRDPAMLSGSWQGANGRGDRQALRISTHSRPVHSESGGKPSQRRCRARGGGRVAATDYFRVSLAKRRVSDVPDSSSKPDMSSGREILTSNAKHGFA